MRVRPDYTIDLFRTQKGFWTRIRAKNHKILWHSEQYKTKQRALLPALKLSKLLKCAIVFHDQINKTCEVI